MKYDGKFNHTTGVYNTPTGARPKEDKMRISTDTMAIIRTALQKWGFDNDIRVSGTNGIFETDKPERFEVNWSAMGNKGTDDARAYAMTIYRAASIADTLNALEIIEDRDRDLDISREEYNTAVKKMADAFESGDAWVAEIIIKELEAKH